jgi:hypothetical protein
MKMKPLSGQNGYFSSPVFSLFDNSQLTEIPRSSLEDFTIVLLNDVVLEKS